MWSSWSLSPQPTNMGGETPAAPCPGSQLPHGTLRSILPLHEHLQLTPPWQGLLEGATSAAGTWEQRGTGGWLLGDQLGDRRAERRLKLGRLKGLRLEGGESCGEEMHRGMLTAPLGPSDAAGAVPV